MVRHLKVTYNLDIIVCKDVTYVICFVKYTYSVKCFPSIVIVHLDSFWVVYTIKQRLVLSRWNIFFVHLVYYNDSNIYHQVTHHNELV